MDDEHCYRVAQSRDGRFDGTFVTAVRTTGIYCRPSCPATTPQRRNVRFFATPAAAQEAGFRACKRCRPDAAPGSPEWDIRADTVARAVRLIGDGVVEREGVSGLAARVGYTPRQLHRLLTVELGTGALRLAVAHRLQHARALLDNTDLPITEIALASGFGSIRQFNDRFRDVFAMTPTAVRLDRPRRGPDHGAGRPAGAPVITANLTYRPPLDLPRLLAFLGRRAVPGAEAWDGSTYRAFLDLPNGPALIAVPAVGPVRSADGRRPHPAVEVELQLSDMRDYATAVSRLRRLLDLDADPAAVAAGLGGDPLLGESVTRRPGLRVPGSANPFETAVRAVVGQQVSVAAARRLLGVLAERAGRPVDGPVRPAESLVRPAEASTLPAEGSVRPEESPVRPAEGSTADATGRDGLVRVFPAPADLAEVDPATLPLPRRRATAVIALAREVAEGRLVLDAGADRDRVHRQLLALPGIGAWTAAYIRMRGLGDPDVWLPGDLVAEREAGRRAGDGPESWKPWRSYAVVHLWASAEERSTR